MFAIYLTEVMLLAAVGTTVGLVVGAILPFAIAAAFGSVLPLPIVPDLHGGELGFAVLYGFPRFLAALGEALPAGQPLPNLADLFQDRCEKLLEQVCMPVQGG